MQRTLFSFVGLLLFVCLTGVVGAQDAPAPAPRIICDQPTYDFGEADNNQVIEHTFVIRNEGDVSLEISSVRATCGCTATDLSHKFIAPGETADLKAKLDLRGRQGRQRKAIMIQSNDPQTPTYTLYFDGTAVTEFQVNPRQLFFGRITADAVVTGVVELVGRSGKTIELRKLEANIPQLMVTNIAVAGGGSHQIVVSTVPPLDKGALRGNIRVETDIASQPVFEIVVSAFIVGELTFAPHEIVLPENPDRSEVRYILCRSEGETPFQIVSVDLPDPAMEARIQPTGPSAYRIEVRNMRPVMDLDGKAVRITTTLEGAKEFAIPLRIVPQPAVQQ